MSGSDDLIACVNAWHDANEHERIVEAIETVSSAERGYALTCLLARAYNNLAQPGASNFSQLLGKALELLASVADEGKTDPLWHFRTGYALYYLDRDDEALAAFQAALELDPTDEVAVQFRDSCLAIIRRRDSVANTYAHTFKQNAEHPQVRKRRN
ncbi:tetratricopeptide repeat protein [Schaalia suimastitidis]|uniref:tetratricopeptide repeat protein n=1 Tax=Schaalia suimastitidis TaxID=121163 RepID=UPI00042843F0|nr:tetratricopeptide repeat protein [Schaalia suimastitidis]